MAPEGVIDNTPMQRELHPWNTDFRWVSPPTPARSLSAQQLRDYDELGYFVLRGVFSASELEALDEAIEPGEQLVRELLEQLPGGRISVAGLDTQTVAPNMVGSSATLRECCTHPRLLGACADLLGPDVRLYWEQAVYKQPHSAAPVLWHQDNGYTYVEPQNYLTCWIAITDATPENGCVSVIPRVHRDGTLTHRSTPIGEECWGDHGVSVDVPVDAGDVIVFSSLTPHATRENTSDEVRKAYIVQYAPDGAVALEGDPHSAGTPARRLLDDPVLNAPVLRDAQPVAF